MPQLPERPVGQATLEIRRRRGAERIGRGCLRDVWRSKRRVQDGIKNEASILEDRRPGEFTPTHTLATYSIGVFRIRFSTI